MDGIVRILVFLIIKLIGPQMMWIDHALREYWRRMWSNGWLTQQGTVEFTTVEPREQFYVAKITYSYSYENEFYSGFVEQYYAREKHADAFGQQFSSGMMIFIRVNPGKPERSQMLFADNVPQVSQLTT